MERELLASRAVAARAIARLGTSPADIPAWRAVLESALARAGDGGLRDPRAWVRSRALRFRTPAAAGVVSYEASNGIEALRAAVRSLAGRRVGDWEILSSGDAVYGPRGYQAIHGLALADLEAIARAASAESPAKEVVS